jgi:hypothetical protein
MIKTFTHDDVIKFVYNELTEEESTELNQAILCDSELQDLYKDMIMMKSQLDASMKMPSESVLIRIKNYSKSFNLMSK